MNTSTRAALQRRLGFAALGALVLVSVTWWLRTGDDSPARGDTANVTAAECGSVHREPTDGAGAHVPDATYDASPPSFGDHAPRWEVRAASFYDVEDRPEVPVLVHNLEHGYNVLWYDQTIVDDDDALRRVKEIANRYATLDRSATPATAFIAVPWTAADGASFPDGMHYAFTHWYADPSDRTRSRADEEGLTMYCSDISAEIVEDWMSDHPQREAPEGYPDLL